MNNADLQNIGSGKVIIAGDEICAGIDFDDAGMIPNSIVIHYESKEEMAKALSNLEWYSQE